MPRSSKRLDHGRDCVIAIDDFKENKMIRIVEPGWFDIMVGNEPRKV